MTGRGPILLLVNPMAGGGRARRAAGEVLAALSEHGLEASVAYSRNIDHARTVARSHARSGETIVTLGGDGTIGAVADVLRGVPGALMGVLPGGRGNDLVRTLGIAIDPVRACEVIATGIPRRLDLGEAMGRAFVGIASVGFDSDANRIANAAPSWLGSFVYAYSALRALRSWRPACFQIELDPPGERLRFTVYSIGAANSRTYGGGMRAAPNALLDDGMIEVVVVESVSKVRFLTTILPKVFKGTHVDLPGVHVFRVAEVEISAERPFVLYGDGEPLGDLPVRVRAVRGAVSVLVPTDTAAFSSPPPPLPAGEGSLPRAPSGHLRAAGSPAGSTEPPLGR